MQKKLHSGTFRALRAFAWITLLSALSACKAYHLGTPAEIPFKSIYIAPVTNHSYAPQAQTITSAMLRENFTRDARVKVLANKENADAVLMVDLTDYERSGAVSNRQDTSIADSFDLRLRAVVSLLDQKTGAYLFAERPIQVTTNAFTSNPYEDDQPITYQLSERQAMEQLARDLARRTTEMVLSPW